MVGHDYEAVQIEMSVVQRQIEPTGTRDPTVIPQTHLAVFDPTQQGQTVEWTDRDKVGGRTGVAEAAQTKPLAARRLRWCHCRIPRCLHLGRGPLGVDLPALPALGKRSGRGRAWVGPRAKTRGG